MPPPIFKPSSSLAEVRYEIRGPLARRADELEQAGATIIKLNVGNPGNFGFRAPSELREAMSSHLPQSDAYCHQKGLMVAREAVVEQQQRRGVADAKPAQVFMGNGVSELIISSLRGLLNPGDEVLIPSPDYPLWTAATVLAGGKPVLYPCQRENGFVPVVAEVARLVGPRTRALVVINPNNPTGAVYPRAVLEGLARLAEEHGLVVFSDEIYDQILYEGSQFVPMAPLVTKTLCGTFSGLSKVYRACGFRVGWLSFSGATAGAQDYLVALDLLCALRLCANVPGQWAVPVALRGVQSIGELTAPGGRLFQARQAILEGVARSRYLDVVKPQGSIYAFVRIKPGLLPDFDDQRFALDLLERRHVFITPGNGFNVPYRDHFRITMLPEPTQVAMVFERIESLLDEYARAVNRASA